MEKLIKIQSELKAPKGQYNSFGKYHYRNAEDILEALKPLLNANACTLILSDSIELLDNRFYVKATATFSDGNKEISVSAYAREEDTKKGMDASQITGAASSYARKYALNGLFLIDDTKESDTTNVEQKKPILELGTENFINCKKVYDANNAVLTKILEKYDVSDEVHSALVL